VTSFISSQISNQLRISKSATLLPTSAIPRAKPASRVSGNSIRWSSAGIYPINTGDFEHLKTAIGKLRLNDAAFVYQPESSVALGFGFSLRISRLTPHGDHSGTAPAGVQHDIIATSPSVVYEVLTTRGEKLLIDNPAHLAQSEHDPRDSGADCKRHTYFVRMKHW